MVWNAVIETATNDLLRANYGDIQYDSATETLLIAAPRPAGGPQVQRRHGAQVHRWDGASWNLVDKYLGTCQLQCIVKLGAEITEFMTSRYGVPQQGTLNLLMNEANSKDWTNRKAYVQTGIDWMVQCLDEYWTKRDAVLAATTVTAVLAVTLDLTTLATADPLTALETARNTVN